MSNTYESWAQWLLRVFTYVQAILPGEWPESYKINNGDKFDFIVVGAGSAGAIVASRLSENPQWKVLLMEAGGNPSLASEIPSLFPYVLGTEYDWKYHAYYDNGTGQAHSNGQVSVSQGKCLGGGSSINFEIYSRGVPADYDGWDKIAPGWSWDDCVPYFKKTEGMTDPNILNSLNHSYLHSSKGPVLVSKPKLNWYYLEKDENILDSFEEIGVKRILEINGLDVYGTTIPHGTFANGRRYSTAEAFLKLDKVRPNLFISKYTIATKILINSETKVAYGVEAMLKTGNVVQVFVDKEIIVSAGTIASPKILMHSGIGPKEELQKFDINVIEDLPVGKNLHDHVVVPIVLEGQKGSNSELLQYFSQQEFPAYPFPMTTGYFNVDNTISLQPQFQFFNVHADANTSAVLLACKAFNFDDNSCQQIQDANLHNEIETTALVLLHAASSGEVKLRSSNPMEYPVIELGFFRDPTDEILFAEGVKFVTQLENTTYFKRVGGEVVKLQVTGCENIEFGTDEYWRCYVRNTASPFLHPTGTCAMGWNGVVDEYLKVFGILGLRVADASVMPSQPSGNTNAPTMMIGERAADLIKACYLV